MQYVINSVSLMTDIANAIRSKTHTEAQIAVKDMPSKINSIQNAEYTIAFTQAPSMPYNFTQGRVVIFNDKLHFLGGYNALTNHYSWDGTTWTNESTLPYSFKDGGACVYDGKIHILGSSSSSSVYKKHYSWDGTTWTQEIDCPYNFYRSRAVTYNNKIYILGSYSNKRYMSSWNGTAWVETNTDLPIDFYDGAVYVYYNKIHIFYGTAHYSFDGVSWTRELNNPFSYSEGGSCIFDNKIWLFSGTDNYSWINGRSFWKRGELLPQNMTYGEAIVYNNQLHLFGGNGGTLNHYVGVKKED